MNQPCIQETQASSTQRFFSFGEIVNGRDASVPVTDDGFLHAVPFVSVTSGKSRDDAGKTIRNLSDDVFSSEHFSARQLSKRGGYPTKLISMQNAIELLMVLPGKMAKKVRKQFKEIIVRYLDGDRSMCHEIEANHSMGKIKSYSKFASKVMGTIQDEDAMIQAREMPPTCYVYATKSPAFPGLIKIGRTVNMAARVSQLNTSCAPAPHVIVAVAPTFDHGRDEKTAHTFFASVRREGEFFELQDSDVINYFATHITPQFNTELAQHMARLHGCGL